MRDIYLPSDFYSNNSDPSIPAERKLEIIANSPVVVEPYRIAGKTYDRTFTVTLPFLPKSYFYINLTGRPECIATNYINVGDKELYGHGIGSRLLKAGIRHGIEKEQRIDRLYISSAQFGMLKTVIRVLGEKNVSTTIQGDRYGWLGDRALDQILDDYPPVEGEAYFVTEVEAKIDRDEAMTWPAPHSYTASQNP